MASSTSREGQLRTYFTNSVKALRPIITSLNGDNSWLWSFPRPTAERNSTGKAYYHIVFEPWLNGPTSQFSSWLIHLRLTQAPAATSGADVEDIARQIEAKAGSVYSANEDRSGTTVDAILLGFHYLDHLHEPTLRTFDKRIPVIASKEGAPTVRKFGYFDTVKVIHDFGANEAIWNSPELHPGGLPHWLTPTRMLGHHELNYCLALVWSHADDNGNEIHETIMQSPHGTRLEEGPLQAFLNAQPPTQRLALFHGLKESRAAFDKNTYGAAGGLALFRTIGKPKYWVVSHSSVMEYSGLVMRMLWVRDTPRTIEWALENAGLVSADGSDQRSIDPNVIDVSNGDILVLE